MQNRRPEGRRLQKMQLIAGLAALDVTVLMLQRPRLRTVTLTALPSIPRHSPVSRYS
jgi:hypothetical protein